MKTAIRIIISVAVGLLITVMLGLIVYVIWFKKNLDSDDFSCADCKDCDGRCVECNECNIASPEIPTEVTLTLEGSTETIPSDSPERDIFIRDFVSDISTTLNVAPSRIKVIDIESGSIKVKFEILPVTNSFEPLVSQVVKDIDKQVSDMGSSLRKGLVTWALVKDQSIVVGKASMKRVVGNCVPPPEGSTLEQDMTTGRVFWFHRKTNKKGWYCKDGEYVTFDPSNPKYNLPWSTTISEDNDKYYSFWKTIFFIFIHPNKDDYVKQILSAKENTDNQFCASQRKKIKDIFSMKCGLPADDKQEIPSSSLKETPVSGPGPGDLFSEIVNKGNCVDSICTAIFPEKLQDITSKVSDVCDNVWGNDICGAIGDVNQCKKLMTSIIQTTFDQEASKQSTGGKNESSDVLNNAINRFLSGDCDKLFRSVEKYYNDIVDYAINTVIELEEENRLDDILQLIIKFGILVKTKDELQEVINKIPGGANININDLVQEYNLDFGSISIGPLIVEGDTEAQVDNILSIYSKFYTWYSINVLGIDSFGIKDRAKNYIQNFLYSFIIDYENTCKPDGKPSPCQQSGECTIGGRGQECPPDFPQQIAKLASGDKYNNKCKDGFINKIGGREIVCGPGWENDKVTINDPNIKINFKNLSSLCKHSSSIIDAKETIEGLISTFKKVNKKVDEAILWANTNKDMINMGIDKVNDLTSLVNIDKEKTSQMVSTITDIKDELIPGFFKGLIDEVPFPAKQILQVFYKGILITMDHLPAESIYAMVLDISSICETMKADISKLHTANAKNRNRVNTILFDSPVSDNYSVKLGKPSGISEIAKSTDIYWSFQHNDIYFTENGKQYPGFPSNFNGDDINKYREWVVTNAQSVGIDPCTCSKSFTISGYDHGLTGGCSITPVYDARNETGQIADYNTSLFDTETLYHHQPICVVSDLCPNERPITEDEISEDNRDEWPQPYYLSKKNVLDQYIEMGFSNPVKDIIGSDRTIPRWRYCNTEIDNTGNFFFQALKLLDTDDTKFMNRKSSVYNIVLDRKKQNTESYKIFIQLYRKFTKCETGSNCTILLSQLEDKFDQMESWLVSNNLVGKIFNDTTLSNDKSIQSGLSSDTSTDGMYNGWFPTITEDEGQDNYLDSSIINANESAFGPFVEHKNKYISELTQRINKTELADVIEKVENNDNIHSVDNVDSTTFLQKIESRRFSQPWGQKQGWGDNIITPYEEVYCSQETCHRDKHTGEGASDKRSRGASDLSDGMSDLWGLRNRILPCPPGYKDSGEVKTNTGWKRKCRWDKENGLHDTVICGGKTDDGYPICQGFGGKNFKDFGEKHNTTGTNSLWWGGSWDSNDLVKCEDIFLPGDQSLTGLYAPDQSHDNVQDEELDKYLELNDEGMWDPNMLNGEEDAIKIKNELGTFYKRDSWLPGGIRGIDRVKLRKCKLLKRADGKTISKWDDDKNKWVD